MPYFYQDQSRTYFAQPEISDGGDFEFTYQDLEDLFLAVLEGNTTEVHEILGTFPAGQSALSAGPLLQLLPSTGLFFHADPVRPGN